MHCWVGGQQESTERRLGSGWGGECGDGGRLVQGTGKRWEVTMMPLASDG